MTQEIPEVKRGWENHQLSKSLRKMAEATEPPENLRWIVVPSEEAAQLFAESFGTIEPGILYASGLPGDTQYAQYAPDGQFLCTVSERELDDEEVLDLRI